jgi:DNA-binding transcriptional regulator YbjK
MTSTAESDPSGHGTARERIVAATLGIIAEDGLDAVRHRRVAERAAVSLGSTSYHFESRDDLIEAAFLQFLVHATAVLDGLFPTSPPALGEGHVVVDLLVDLIDREFQNPSRVLAEYEMILYAARHESVAAEFRRWEAAHARALSELFAAVGVERHDDAAHTVIALVRGIELQRVSSPNASIDVRQRIGDVVTGLLAASRRAETAS